MPGPVDLSKTDGFGWDEANIGHIARHGVTPKEAEQVFFDKNHRVTRDRKHSTGEKRSAVFGKTVNNRHLAVVFTVRKSKIRVVTARDMNRNERR